MAQLGPRQASFIVGILYLKYFLVGCLELVFLVARLRWPYAYWCKGVQGQSCTLASRAAGCPAPALPGPNRRLLTAGARRNPPAGHRGVSGPRAACGRQRQGVRSGGARPCAGVF